jgi:hypothetical protein
MSGLFPKFLVTRTDGKDVSGKDFFVLEWSDPAARQALAAYARACRETNPDLSNDILNKLMQTSALKVFSVSDGEEYYAAPSEELLLVWLKECDPSMEWDVKEVEATSKRFVVDEEPHELTFVELLVEHHYADVKEQPSEPILLSTVYN